MQNLSKENIIQFLKLNKEHIHKKYGVISIGLMGSFARDEQTPESDIDFIVEFDEADLKNLAGLSRYFENNFQKKIDIVINSKYLNKTFKELNEKDTLYA